MNIKRVTTIILAFSLMVFSQINEVYADQYPSKPIKLVCPQKPGGPTDSCLRTVAKYLEKYLGVSTAVVNIAGAATTVATNQVYSAKPDGYTFLINHLALHTAYHTGVGKFTWDELTPICRLATYYRHFLIHPDSPWRSVRELIAGAKKRPGQIKWGINIGAASHFALMGFENATGTKFLPVAGGGAAQQVTAILGKHIDISAQGTTAADQYITTGKLISLALDAPHRLSPTPNVPTLIEQGITNFRIDNSQTLYGPPGIPIGIADKINEAVLKMSKDPNAIKEFDKFGIDVAYLDQKATKEYLVDYDAEVYKLCRLYGLIPSRIKK